MINDDIERALEDAKSYDGSIGSMGGRPHIYLVKYLALALKTLMMGIMALPCNHSQLGGDCCKEEMKDEPEVKLCPPCDLKKKLGGL